MPVSDTEAAPLLCSVLLCLRWWCGRERETRPAHLWRRRAAPLHALRGTAALRARRAAASSLKRFAPLHTHPSSRLTLAAAAMGKRSGTSKFPVARIKKIMQSNEEVGKVAQATPVLICACRRGPPRARRSGTALTRAPTHSQGAGALHG